MAKTKEEKDAELEAARVLKEQAEADALKQGGNLSDEELAAIEAEGIRIEADLKAKKDAKDAARLGGEGQPAVEKTYSESAVKDMMRTLIAEMQAKQKKDGEEGVDEEDLYKQKKIRLPRFQNKFVLGFANKNDDEYFPELVVHAFDVWDELQKKMVAWVELVFEDDTHLKVPLYTALVKSIKVDCDLVEVVKTDKTYSNGKVEIRTEVEEYHQKGSGAFTKLKVELNEYKFKVRLPDGKEVIVGPEIVNW